MALIDNLISYYKLDWNSNDSVGWNNGTDTAITYSVGNGKTVQGAWFNGSSSRISPPSGSIRPTGNFTINAWFKTSSTVNQWIFQTYSQASSIVSWFTFAIVSNKLEFVSGNNTGATLNTSYKVLAGATTVTTGNWIMATARYNGTVLEVFVNAVSDGNTAWTNAPAYQGDSKPAIWTINYQHALTTAYFNGAIDELWVWNRALTPTEITTLYNGWVGLSYPFSTTTTNPAFFLNLL